MYMIVKKNVFSIFTIFRKKKFRTIYAHENLEMLKM